MKELNHEMIVLAREYRNLTQEQLARSIFVSQATIAKIEGGLMSDAPELTIERLAKALDFPKEFFYQNNERLGFGSSAFYYRKRAKITASDRKKISGIVNLIRISLEKLLDAVDLEAKRELPFFEIEEYGGSASNVAKALRVSWSLPEGPIGNITSLIESAGVIIVPCKFGTRFMDGTSLRLTNMPPLIFINSDMPGDRWRFTLAHELGHLIMHQIPSETMENEADLFASEFLLPDIDLNAQFSRYSQIRIQDLANIKPYWKVSIGALLMKADSLGFLTANKKRYLWSQMAKFGYKTKEPNPIEKEPVNNYPNLFDYYKKELKYSVDDMAKTVLINPQEFELLHASVFPPSQNHSHQPSLRVI